MGLRPPAACSDSGEGVSSNETFYFRIIVKYWIDACCRKMDQPGCLHSIAHTSQTMLGSFRLPVRRRRTVHEREGQITSTQRQSPWPDPVQRCRQHEKYIFRSVQTHSRSHQRRCTVNLIRLSTSRSCRACERFGTQLFANQYPLAKSSSMNELFRPTVAVTQCNWLYQAAPIINRQTNLYGIRCRTVLFQTQANTPLVLKPGLHYRPLCKPSSSGQLRHSPRDTNQSK